MSTPPSDPNRPQDQPPYPPIPGRPNQPGGPQYPGPQQYPGQQNQPGFPKQPAYPNQSGGYGPQYDPSQPGYNPYAAGGGGYGFNYAPPGELAGWGVRAVASILDSLVGIVPVLAGLVVAVAISGSMESMNSAGGVALVIAYLSSFALQIWNRVIRQGRTGQSLGKKVVGLKIVSPDTGALIGLGRTLGREVCAVIFNNFCFLNLLWPLWDDKKQTWHDKVATDIVIRA